MVGFGTLPYKTHAKQTTLLYQNKMFLPKTSPTASVLYDFFAIDTTSGAMVGDAGTILKYNSDLFEFELDVASGVVTAETLFSVAFTDAANGVAVGEACTILGWDGVSWTLSADSGMLPNVRLRSVYHFGAFLIACGNDIVTDEVVILHKGWYIDAAGGYVWRASWDEVYRSSDMLVLRDVDAYTLYNIVCGGSSGKYVESADWGNTWSAVKQTPISGVITDFTFGAFDYGFAVSSLGEIAKWDGTSWSLLPSPTSVNLDSVIIFSSDFALAVGNGGAIVAWDGRFWNEYPSPTGLGLISIFAITANFCWLCGINGFIAQFQSQTYPSLLIDSAGNAMGGHGKVIGKVEGSENLPLKQKAVTGILETETIVTLGAGTPILELDSYTGADLAYQTLVSWTVGAGTTGILREVAFTRDSGGKADFKVTIGAVVITDFNPKAHVDLPFSPNELVAGTVVKIEVKSSDGSTINVDGNITGDEQ